MVNENETDPRQVDTDGDGLSDGVESATGTNPLDPDSDGDGLSDSWNRDGRTSAFETDPDNLIPTATALRWRGRCQSEWSMGPG